MTEAEGPRVRKPKIPRLQGHELRETDEHADAAPDAAEPAPVVAPAATVPVGEPHAPAGAGRLRKHEGPVPPLGRDVVAVLPELLEGRLVHAGLVGLSAREHLAPVDQAFARLVKREKLALRTVLELKRVENRTFAHGFFPLVIWLY